MRKSLLRALLTVFILLSVCALCTGAAYADEGTITGSDVNLRAGPGYTYDIIACMPRGAVVTVNDRSNPSWTAVTFNGSTGFVSAGYVSTSAASVVPVVTAAPVPVSGAQTGTIIGNYVNFRTGPSADAAIQGVLNYGTAVSVLSEINGWTNISVNGMTGYVSGNYVQRSGNTVLPAVTAAPVIVTPAPAVTAAPTSGSGDASINADGVNLRSGPSSGYAILGAFDRGTSVTVLSESNGWSRVIVNGHEGYMFSRYITRNSAVVPAPTQQIVVTPTVPAVVSGGDGTINADGVNLRSGPGSNFGILGSFDRGTAVTVGATANNWTAVIINGTSGYVYSSYITQGAVLPSPAPVATPEPTPVPTPVPTVAPAPDGTNATLNDDYVYLWSRPTNRSDVRGSFDKGTRIIVQSESDGWSYVLINGYPGYVHSEYITPDNAPIETPAPTEAPAATAAPAPESLLDSGSGIINADGVNFRESASTYSAIRGCFDKGTVVTITGTSGSWTACTVNGVSGYIYSSYVTRGTAQSATPTEAPSTTTRTGVINADYVHFRSGPSSSNTILGTYSTGKAVTVTGSSGDWTACTIDGISGYVFSQYVTETTPASTEPTPAPTPSTAATDSGAGYITGTSVNFRSGPSTSSQILGTYNSGKSVTVTGQSGDWTACTIDGVSGYVYSSYVRSGTITVSGDSSALGSQIAQYALQFVGYRYVWAGTSPATGFDCSGLVQYVYSHFNYSLPRVANDQAACGIAVSHAELQPGDLLGFYSGGSYVGHIGIYIGNNQFVHASSSTTGVIVSELSGYYENRGYTARRIVGVSAS